MRIRLPLLCMALTIFVVLSSSVSGQKPKDSAAASSSILIVGGAVEHPLRLTATDLAKLSHQSVKAKDHDGKEATFEGIPIVDLLKMAGVALGEQLRSKKLADYLVAEGADGYRAVFALPELDPAFNDRVIILADRRDGNPLSAKHGPLQIIVPGEKRHGRWVRRSFP